jgi:hypothetical protein
VPSPPPIHDASSGVASRTTPVSTAVALTIHWDDAAIYARYVELLDKLREELSHRKPVGGAEEWALRVFEVAAPTAALSTTSPPSPSRTRS